jgi:hypothetical protein
VHGARTPSAVPTERRREREIAGGHREMIAAPEARRRSVPSLKARINLRPRYWQPLAPEAHAGARAVEKRYSPGAIQALEGDHRAALIHPGQGSVKYSKLSQRREVMLTIETAPSSVAEVPLFDGARCRPPCGVDEVVAYRSARGTSSRFPA